MFDFISSYYTQTKRVLPFRIVGCRKWFVGPTTLVTTTTSVVIKLIGRSSNLRSACTVEENAPDYLLSIINNIGK